MTNTVITESRLTINTYLCVKERCFKTIKKFLVFVVGCKNPHDR